MYVTISDFIKEWNREAMLTQKVLDGLTDDSLKQQVYPEGRTLGRIAWHFTTNIPDYLTTFGLEMKRVDNAQNVPSSAREIAETFKKVSAEASQTIEQQWTDNSLSQIQKAFGREETNAQILMGLIKHIVHHRGQLTILIRQAELKPFGVYGPPKEDWVNLGVENPPL
ncbi:DinB family protein [Peribacillus asahii]|uniref:DinB family protein n=1 Tax=Peribacillus asahii TaxID=228899 RepID=UPI002079E8FC|nr:DinB family protein [Peribacillus asahii]USK61531.1 DinB family protein [Peribacillus asahii]